MSSPLAEDIRLLVRLVRRDAPAVDRLLATGRASLERLAGADRLQGIAVVLLDALEALDRCDRLPAPALAQLKERRRRQEVRSVVLLRALEDVTARFADAALPVVLLKGPYLADRFYGRLGAREFGDLDLLVPSSGRTQADALLHAAGYARRSGVLLGASLTSFFVHGFDYGKEDARLDLHWRLSRHPSLHVDAAALWRKLGSWRVGERTHAVLSDEHEVVFAALSLVRDLERRRAKVKNVLDVIQVVAAVDGGHDWEATFASGRREGTLGPLVNVLALCLDLADAADLAPRLAAILDRWRERRVAFRAGGSPLVCIPERCGVGNKLWSARVHDSSLVGWLAWWAVSLPFRISVHRRAEAAVAARAMRARG